MRRTSSPAGSASAAMKPTAPKTGAAASATSSNSASAMNASGWTGPPTKTGSAAPGSPWSAGTASAAGTSDGWLSTKPMAPSSSWWVISATVFRKFGSTSAGDETSSCPCKEFMPLRELPLRAGSKRLEDAAGHNHAVDLVRTVVDPAAARHHQHVRERRLVGEPARSVHLHRPVDDVVQHLRRVELDRRDLDPRVPSLVDLVRRIERHQPACLNLDVAVRDPVLHRLL